MKKTQGFEVDSDVNDDPNREVMLDQSFEAFYNQVKQQIEAKDNITNVPKDNVYDEVIED